MQTLEKLFKRLLSIDITFGLYDENKIDFIKELPLEISSIVMAMLDWRSLKYVAMVSRSWKRISEYEQRRRRRLLRRMSKTRKYVSAKSRERKIFDLIRTNKDAEITYRTNQKLQIFAAPEALNRQGRTNIRV